MSYDLVHICWVYRSVVSEVLGLFQSKTYYSFSFIPYMATIPKLEHYTLHNSFASEIKSLSAITNLKVTQGQKTIRDDDAISMKDFSYLIVCRSRVLIYRDG